MLPSRQSDESYMRRGLELALMGHGHVSPNPLVGAVVVHKDTIIGEGWHKQFGGPHAEVNAIASVQNPEFFKEATIYVTLEPCCHTGKTPPCTGLIISSGIKRVVVACQDPNPLVAGKGIARLREEGIEVITGCLETDGKEINRRFFAKYEKRRPYVILKWAETSDGFIARENYDSKWISQKLSRNIVHKWRTEEDAVMVGYRTVFHDNPRLTARSWPGRNPVRVVFDKYLDLFKSPGKLFHLFDGKVPTIVFNFLEEKQQENLDLVKIDPTQNHVAQSLEHLHNRSVLSVMVEGGSELINQFLKSGLWDEARVFKAPVIFGKGIDAPVIRKATFLKEEIVGDELLWYRNTLLP